MPSVRSIKPECLDRVRTHVEFSVVAISQRPIIGPRGRQGAETFVGSGFVLAAARNRCVVITTRKNISTSSKGNMNYFVRFKNGQSGRCKIIRGPDHKILGDRLVAFVVTGLNFKPQSIEISKEEVSQFDSVVHMGHFDARYPGLNFSSGHVGVTGHDLTIDGRRLTQFAHCCSRKEDHIGGPVFNLKSKLVGINFSRRIDKSIFLAMDIRQSITEFKEIFGKNWKDSAMAHLK